MLEWELLNLLEQKAAICIQCPFFVGFLWMLSEFNTAMQSFVSHASFSAESREFYWCI